MKSDASLTASSQPQQQSQASGVLSNATTAWSKGSPNLGLKSTLKSKQSGLGLTGLASTFTTMNETKLKLQPLNNNSSYKNIPKNTTGKLNLNLLNKSDKADKSKEKSGKESDDAEDQGADSNGKLLAGVENGNKEERSKAKATVGTMSFKDRLVKNTASDSNKDNPTEDGGVEGKSYASATNKKASEAQKFSSNSKPVYQQSGAASNEPGSVFSYKPGFNLRRSDSNTSGNVGQESERLDNKSIVDGNDAGIKDTTKQTSRFAGTRFSSIGTAMRSGTATLFNNREKDSNKDTGGFSERFRSAGQNLGGNLNVQGKDRDAEEGYIVSKEKDLSYDVKKIRYPVWRLLEINEGSALTKVKLELSQDVKEMMESLSSTEFVKPVLTEDYDHKKAFSEWYNELLSEKNSKRYAGNHPGTQGANDDTGAASSTGPRLNVLSHPTPWKATSSASGGRFNAANRYSSKDNDVQAERSGWNKLDRKNDETFGDNLEKWNPGTTIQQNNENEEFNRTDVEEPRAFISAKSEFGLMSLAEKSKEFELRMEKEKAKYQRENPTIKKDDYEFENTSTLNNESDSNEVNKALNTKVTSFFGKFDKNEGSKQVERNLVMDEAALGLLAPQATGSDALDDLLDGALEDDLDQPPEEEIISDSEAIEIDNDEFENKPSNADEPEMITENSSAISKQISGDSTEQTEFTTLNALPKPVFEVTSDAIFSQTLGPDALTIQTLKQVWNKDPEDVGPGVRQSTFGKDFEKLDAQAEAQERIQRERAAQRAILAHQNLLYQQQLERERSLRNQEVGALAETLPEFNAAVDLRNAAQRKQQLTGFDATSMTSDPHILLQGPQHPVQRHREFLPGPWFYRDPQGNARGPFKSSQMRDWIDGGFFNESLPIAKHSPSNVYTPLGQWFKGDLENAFYDMSVGDTHRPEAGIDINQQMAMRQKLAVEEQMRRVRQQEQQLLLEQQRRQAIERQQRQQRQQQQLQQRQQLLSFTGRLTPDILNVNSTLQAGANLHNAGLLSDFPRSGNLHNYASSSSRVDREDIHLRNLLNNQERAGFGGNARITPGLDPVGERERYILAQKAREQQELEFQARQQQQRNLQNRNASLQNIQGQMLQPSGADVRDDWTRERLGTRSGAAAHSPFFDHPNMQPTTLEARDTGRARGVDFGYHDADVTSRLDLRLRQNQAQGQGPGVAARPRDEFDTNEHLGQSHFLGDTAGSITITQEIDQPETNQNASSPLFSLKHLPEAVIETNVQLPTSAVDGQQPQQANIRFDVPETAVDSSNSSLVEDKTFNELSNNLKQLLGVSGGPRSLTAVESVGKKDSKPEKRDAAIQSMKRNEAKNESKPMVQTPQTNASNQEEEKMKVLEPTKAWGQATWNDKPVVENVLSLKQIQEEEERKANLELAKSISKQGILQQKGKLWADLVANKNNDMYKPEYKGDYAGVGVSLISGEGVEESSDVQVGALAVASKKATKNEKTGGRMNEQSMSSEFNQWCKTKLEEKGINLASKPTWAALIQYCYGLESHSDIREVLRDNLGSTPEVSQFATEFIRKKNEVTVTSMANANQEPKKHRLNGHETQGTLGSSSSTQKQKVSQPQGFTNVGPRKGKKKSTK